MLRIETAKAATFSGECRRTIIAGRKTSGERIVTTGAVKRREVQT